MSSAYLSGLNPAQRKAVETTNGRLLVLAGAGSGKTKVLTSRIAYLINEKNIEPEAILGVTFTNKAAQEMRARLALLIGRKISERVTLSTFHSFALQLLRKEIHHLGYSRTFTIADRHDIQRLLQAIVQDELDHDSLLPSVNQLYEEITKAKNQAKRPEEVTFTGSSFFEKLLKKSFARLNESMRVYGMLDFDHLLYATWQLFQECPEVLKRYQNRYQYVLIDEYQDTNPIQAQIANFLTAASGNLCVVGDDDQSIYSWRGADVANILQFPADNVVKLEQNFRSTNTILKAANAVIGKNSNRYQKALWSSGGDGERIEVFCAPNEDIEAEGIVRRMAVAKRKLGIEWSDFCILYRSNILTKPIENALLRAPAITKGAVPYPIPYTIVGQDDLFDHKEMKDLSAYLRVACNPSDEGALVRVINYPRRGVGEQSLQQIKQQAHDDGSSLWQVFQKNNRLEALPEKAKKGVLEFQTTVIDFQRELLESGAAVAVNGLLKRTRFMRALEHDIASDSLRKRAEERIESFIQLLSSQPNLSSPEALGDFLAQLHIDSAQSPFQQAQDLQNGVTMMTFHGAKGLEYPYCFLIGLEDHLIPHERNVDEGQVEEERRLLYVAITRAKKNLCMSMVEARRRLGGVTSSRPSRFMFDIPQECIVTTRWND